MSPNKKQNMKLCQGNTHMAKDCSTAFDAIDSNIAISASHIHKLSWAERHRLRCTHDHRNYRPHTRDLTAFRPDYSRQHFTRKFWKGLVTTIVSYCLLIRPYYNFKSYFSLQLAVIRRVLKSKNTINFNQSPKKLVNMVPTLTCVYSHFGSSKNGDPPTSCHW